MKEFIHTCVFLVSNQIAWKMVDTAALKLRNHITTALLVCLIKWCSLVGNINKKLCH